MLSKLTFYLFLVGFAVSQLPEDDLVTATIPGYPHDIYSGSIYYIQGILMLGLLEPKNQSTMFFSNRRKILLRILLLFG